MPIIIMALVALGMFIAMGLLLFYAAYAETKTEHANTHKSAQAKPVA